MIDQQYPILIIIGPLLMSFAVSISGWLNKRIAFYLSAAALAFAAVDSLLLLFTVLEHGPQLYKLGGWPPPMGIVYYVDGLSGLVLAVISWAAFINLLGTKQAVEQSHAGKEPAFYTLYLLAVCGHLGMVITGDAFNLYVLLEIAALSGYALLGMGDRRAPLSTLNYLLIGTIGASFYLLGVGFLYIKTGSLNMLDLARIMPAVAGSPTVLAALALITVGTMVKMAFFPLHGWLPNVYTYASSPASSLIAPMTTKVMVYVMVRMMLTVFSPGVVFGMSVMADVIVAMAVAAMVMGGVMALASRNLKRMLTYVVIAEVGYMVGGAWLGNATGMTGAVLHIANDAAMTLTMFMAVGCMHYKLGGVDYPDLKGLFQKMPFTMAAFVLGAIAMIGVPPTCGFFSKWWLIMGGLEAGNYVFVGALIFSSLVNVILFFRVFEICFFEPEPEHSHDEEESGGGGHHPHPPHLPMDEAPVGMLIPLGAAALSLIGLGLITSQLVAVIHNVVTPGLY